MTWQHITDGSCYECNGRITRLNPEIESCGSFLCENGHTFTDHTPPILCARCNRLRSEHLSGVRDLSGVLICPQLLPDVLYKPA